MREYVCDEEKCTMCMACANACPRDAIHVGINRFGYEKITIDSKRCIDCSLCSKICNKRSLIPRNEALACFAGQAKHREKIKKSASGGSFQILAEIVLEDSGVCYGCAGYFEDGHYVARHIRVSAIEKLPLILNSKYILSRIETCYRQIKEDLIAGKTVLFGGTPCQAVGLKAFLGKEYDNLLIVDVVCHGVTSRQIFNDYLHETEKARGITITDYCFRDKHAGWGSNFCYPYYKGKNKGGIHTIHLPKEGGSHEIHYLRGDISRENCFSCEMASPHRVSDFTFGDFWSIESEYPELITQKHPPLSTRSGINCMMINTKKGIRYLPRLQEKMIMYPVDLDSIIRHNSNFLKPSNRGKKRDTILKQYCEKGYSEIEKNYCNTVGKKMLLYTVKNTVKSHLPDKLKVSIYRMAFLRKMLSGE